MDANPVPLFCGLTASLMGSVSAAGLWPADSPRLILFKFVAAHKTAKATPIMTIHMVSDKACNKAFTGAKSGPGFLERSCGAETSPMIRTTKIILDNNLPKEIGPLIIYSLFLLV